MTGPTKRMDIDWAADAQTAIDVGVSPGPEQVPTGAVRIRFQGTSGLCIDYVITPEDAKGFAAAIRAAAERASAREPRCGRVCPAFNPARDTVVCALEEGHAGRHESLPFPGYPGGVGWVNGEQPS